MTRNIEIVSELNPPRIVAKDNGTTIGNFDFTKANGDRYVCKFLNGQLDGWVIARISGDLRMFTYEDGQINTERQVYADTWIEENMPCEKTDPLLQHYAVATFLFEKGCLFGDCENGIGVSYFGSMGYVYYGPHKNGKPEGIGEMYWAGNDMTTYKGPFKDGKLHGMISKYGRDLVYLDRIFYEGKMESGFYNSMEQFESILAKEIEEIERDFANRPKEATIEYTYPDNGNYDNNASGSQDTQKEKPEKMSNGGFYTCKFLIAGSNNTESYYAIADVWATVYTDNTAELSSMPVQLNFESRCGTAMITYKCNDDGTGGKGHYEDNCYKGGVVLVSWDLKTWNSGSN